MFGHANHVALMKMNGCEEVVHGSCADRSISLDVRARNWCRVVDCRELV